MTESETVLSVRLPANDRIDLERFIDEEKFYQKSEAARKLIEVGLQQWKIETALEKFAEGKITLNKAAEIAEVNVWQFMTLVKERKIVWVKTKKEELEKDIKEAMK